jgi:hypothetical protein
VSRLWSFARRYGFDVLIAIGAIESALEVAFRHDAALEPRTTLWFAVPAVAVSVLVLLGRRRWPFAAPVFGLAAGRRAVVRRWAAGRVQRQRLRRWDGRFVPARQRP